jgi:hypothetical protein
MVQIPILSGIFTDGVADVRQSFPVNMMPVGLVSGVSNGYLRPADGLVEDGEGPGVCRGGINWLGTLYRVMGTKLVSIDASANVVEIGDVGEGGTVTFAYGFADDFTPFTDGGLAIASGGRLYLYDGSTFAQVTDANLGVCADVIWIGGYFVSTDREFLVVSDLTDPFSWSATKYASNEANPDPIVAVLRLRNEIYSLNRFTIEVFGAIVTDGTTFPFGLISGAQIQKGCIGTHACCVFLDSIAFLGSAENEAPGIYLGANGQTSKLSTEEVDHILSGYTETQLADVVVETRNDGGHAHLYVHLPDRALVFDATASRDLEQPVWFVLTSSLAGYSQYRGRHFVWAYDAWQVGDPSSSSFGHVDNSVGSHFGDVVRWEFATPMLYAESRAAQIDQLELVALPGRVALGVNATMSTSYSLDGMTWSQDATISVGSIGERTKRLQWRRQGRWRHLRMQRFRGDSNAHVSFLRLEAAVTPLAW